LNAFSLWKCFAVTLQVLLAGTYDCQILALSPTDGSVIATIDGLRTPDEAVGEICSIVVHDDNQALVAYSAPLRKTLVRYCRYSFSLLRDNAAVLNRGGGSSLTAQHGAPPEHSVSCRPGVLACHNEQPHSGASLWSAVSRSLPLQQQRSNACARVEHTNIYVTLHHGPHSGKGRLTFANLGLAVCKEGLVWDKMFAAAVHSCYESPPQILSACGVLLIQASRNRVAVWHFPDVPD